MPVMYLSARTAMRPAHKYPGPVALRVRRRDGQGICLKLHRRFDPYVRAVYILAEETSDDSPDIPQVREGRSRDRAVV